ncbi:putative Prophage transcriptional regulator [Vibrio crassostreae]|uniref:Prophage transcriptional regulator n=1 Tax=Vibrio crassostreae TaxID=246167 RepID=A0ABP1WZ04_9VIBR|nr:XRE family transcriptional regulator [Vibrio crassostreae]TCL30399.1 phage repressor protein C with HTH and peptisase S24 domain [Vibrio crassostreae]CAK1714024.1 putative Prophage transcriptional regulator [Vibrio crassostreae]CAK1715006.1 putative Prophage transcriptional regulator [Vibrio crassostreae]CAK1715181.1 putative Prophage transcriptional regulator [Vibrio crassostreae]CAK1715916.1 putative Prophage transcriptional regulator [Vibrio crassostreae]
MTDSYKEITLEEKNEGKRFFRSGIKNRFAQRLEEAMAGEANLSFAQKCGISEATIRKYKKGETTPNLEILESIAKVSGKAIQWLIGVESETVKVKTPISENITYIEKFNVIASAGGGAYIDTEVVAELYPFSLEFLKRHRLSHADLCIIEARGDSMEPTLSSGDDLIIDRKEFTAHKVLQGIHVISIDGELKVKRLEFDLVKDGYSIISDNHLYQEDFIERKDLNCMRIIGEVVMILGKPPKGLPELH